MVVMRNIAIFAKTQTISMLNLVKNLDANSLRLALSTWLPQSWRKKLTKLNLTTEEIEVRIWGFVVIAVTLILMFIVGALLYSVTFVTQPIKSMAPIDQAYTKMLNDIVLLIVGGIGGVIGKRAMSSASRAFNPPTQPMCQPMGYGGSQGGFNPSYAPPQSAYGLPSQPFGAMPVWKNPELDESWTPGPPPTTPPDHLEDDQEREELAQARKEAE
jgi:uncharacterized protein YjeT (DUF2065 family)